MPELDTAHAPEMDDPWIAAYMAFRAGIQNGTIATPAQAEEFAHELKRQLPAGEPSVSAAMFITADIALTLSGQVPRDLVAGLWTPGFPPRPTSIHLRSLPMCR